jgi:hypothetical protein
MRSSRSLLNFSRIALLKRVARLILEKMGENKMRTHAKIVAALALGLLLATNAHARNETEIAQELSAAAAKAALVGNTPDQVAAFLKSRNFYPGEYARAKRTLSGYSMYDKDGSFTPDSTQAAYAANADFSFDERDRLQDYRVSVQKVDR